MVMKMATIKKLTDDDFTKILNDPQIKQLIHTARLNTNAVAAQWPLQAATPKSMIIGEFVTQLRRASATFNHSIDMISLTATFLTNEYAYNPRNWADVGVYNLLDTTERDLKIHDLTSEIHRDLGRQSSSAKQMADLNKRVDRFLMDLITQGED